MESTRFFLALRLHNPAISVVFLAELDLRRPIFGRVPVTNSPTLSGNLEDLRGRVSEVFDLQAPGLPAIAIGCPPGEPIMAIDTIEMGSAGEIICNWAGFASHMINYDGLPEG